MSKTILAHPHVAEVEYPPDSDYKMFVYLKPGYIWEGYGTTGKGVHSVREFLWLKYKIVKGEPA
jgi:hypothetical protein